MPGPPEFPKGREQTVGTKCGELGPAQLNSPSPGEGTKDADGGKRCLRGVTQLQRRTRESGRRWERRWGRLGEDQREGDVTRAEAGRSPQHPLLALQ